MILMWWFVICSACFFSNESIPRGDESLDVGCDWNTRTPRQGRKNLQSYVISWSILIHLEWKEMVFQSWLSMVKEYRFKNAFVRMLLIVLVNPSGILRVEWGTTKRRGSFVLQRHLLTFGINGCPNSPSLIDKHSAWTLRKIAMSWPGFVHFHQ